MIQLMLQIYEQSAYFSKLDFYFGHFLLIVNAYKGGPRTQIFKGEWEGGSFSPGMGFLRLRLIPIMIFQGGGSGHPPMAPFSHTQRWSGPEQ